MESYENLDLKKRSKKIVSHETTLLILFFALSLIIVIFFTVPKYRQVKLLKMEEEVKNGNLKIKKDMIVKVEDFNRSYRNLNDYDLAKFYNLLPDKSSAEEQIANIYKLAGTSMRIKEIEIAELEKANNAASGENNNLEAINIKVSVAGRFSDFFVFLSALENSIPLASLDELEIEKEDARGMAGSANEGGAGEESNILKYNISFLSYHLKQS